MYDIIQALLKPENRVLLWVLLIIVALFVVYLMYLTKVGALKWKLPFVESTHEGDEGSGPRVGGKKRRYRKILYVKVICLSDREKSSSPVYHRTVDRLGESDKRVPVFDEAVYYTLELFPNKAPLAPRKERSSGVVDPSMIIPWQDRVVFRDAGSSRVKEFVQLESDEPTDTFLSVSHFENGLQGSINQDIGTDVPEDAEYVRVIVDFSSIPNANQYISAERATVSRGGRESIAPIARQAPGVFAVRCDEVAKGSVVTIGFRFDWSRASAS